MVNLRSAKKIASFSVALSTLAFVVGQAPRATALTFQFDYTYDTNNFFDTTSTDGNTTGSARRATLEAAADYFEPLTDNLTEINATAAGKTWIPKFTHPGTGESYKADGDNNGTETYNAANDFTNYQIAENTILIFAGGRDLSGSTLGSAGPGGYSASTSFIDNIISRGQSGSGTTADPATDFALWGGSISFDNAVTWNNSHTIAPSSEENDLLSVAIHELGHVLGIGFDGYTVSETDQTSSWENNVNGTNFIGATSVAEHGGNVPLEADTYHWENGTTSTINGTGDFETAFDPSLTTGTRKLLTDLDYAGLTDVGWETQAVYSAAVPFEFSPGLGIVLVSGLFGASKVWQTRKNNKQSTVNN